MSNQKHLRAEMDELRRENESLRRMVLALMEDHAGMMTRRRVLEKLVSVAKWADAYRRDGLSEEALRDDYAAFAYARVLHLDDFLGDAVVSAARELALLMDAERTNDLEGKP